MNSFRKIIFLFFTLSLGISYLIEKNYSETNKINYLNYRAANLKQHVISSPSIKAESNVLMLGSSSLAGSNVPKNSTITDFLNESHKTKSTYFYNLGMLEGALLDSFVFLKLAQNERKIDLIILGISPDMFIRNTDSIPLAVNYQKVKNNFDASLQQEIEERFKSKLYFNFVTNFLAEKSLPYQFILNVKHHFYYWQRQLFGDAFTSHVKNQGLKKLPFEMDNNTWVNLLDPILQFSDKNQIKIKVYFEPHLYLDKYFDPHEYQAFKTKVTDYFKKRNIIIYDFDQAIPNSPQYFIDYVHLTPEGNKLLATKINEVVLIDGGTK